MAQSLDSSIWPLLKVVMIPGHVEWGECWATPLHGAGNGWWGQRHSKSAIWWQRALYGVRNGCCYGCRAGAKSSQGLWVLKCRKTGWRRYPGAKRQIIRCCKGWSWKKKKKISLDEKLCFNMLIKNYIICKRQFKKIHIYIYRERERQIYSFKEKQFNQETSLPFHTRGYHLYHIWKREIW